MNFPGLPNPWALVGALLLAVASFFYGVHLEHGRFEAYQEKVTAAGEAQARRAGERARDNKRLKQEADNAYKTKLASLRGTVSGLQRRLRTEPSSSFVPTRQQPVGSQCPAGQVCYDAAEFDAALRDFAADVAGQVGEGETLGLKLDTGIDWIAQQRKRSWLKPAH